MFIKAVHQLQYLCCVAPDNDPWGFVQTIEGKLKITQILLSNGIAEKNP